MNATIMRRARDRAASQLITAARNRRKVASLTSPTPSDGEFPSATAASLPAGWVVSADAPSLPALNGGRKGRTTRRPSAFSKLSIAELQSSLDTAESRRPGPNAAPRQSSIGKSISAKTSEEHNLAMAAALAEKIAVKGSKEIHGHRHSENSLDNSADLDKRRRVSWDLWTSFE